MQTTEKPSTKEKQKKKDALAKTQELEGRASLITTMEDLHLFSTAVYKAQMWRGIKSPESAMVRIQAGRELGLRPIMALNKIHVTPRGDIIIAAAVLGAVAMDQGVRWKIIQKDKKGCTLKIFKKDSDIPEHTETFTMEDAKAAGLAYKDNYKAYPEEMCYNRCLAKGLRTFDPRIGAGFYTKEEMDGVSHFGPTDQEKTNPEEEDIQDAEIVEEDSEYEADVEEALEEATDQGEEDAGPPREDTAGPADKKKEEDVAQIKKHLEVLKLDPKDFKTWLSEVQKKKTYVRKNTYGHLSFSCAPAEDISFLRKNAQKISRRYVEAKMEKMKPGEKIGCFIVPEETDA